jgi:hypothetical protein
MTVSARAAPRDVRSRRSRAHPLWSNSRSVRKPRQCPDSAWSEAFSLRGVFRFEMIWPGTRAGTPRVRNLSRAPALRVRNSNPERQAMQSSFAT